MSADSETDIGLADFMGGSTTSTSSSSNDEPESEIRYCAACGMSFDLFDRDQVETYRLHQSDCDGLDDALDIHGFAQCSDNLIATITDRVRSRKPDLADYVDNCDPHDIDLDKIYDWIDAVAEVAEVYDIDHDMVYRTLPRQDAIKYNLKNVDSDRGDDTAGIDVWGARFQRRLRTVSPEIPAYKDYDAESYTVDGHRYARIVETDDGDDVDPFTTFVIYVKSYLHDPVDGSVEIDMSVVPDSAMDDRYDVVVEPSIFNDVSAFKEQVCIGKTTSFNGSYDDLEALRQIVTHQPAPDKVGVTKAGLYDDEFVTPSGVISDNWWTSDTQYRYKSTGQALDAKWDIDDDSDGTFDEDTVSEILELLPHTRDKERFLPVLGWWYAALLAPKIRDWEGELPSLMVSADTGAGKTSTLQTMSKLLGLDGDPYSARDTKFAILKALSSTNNIPIWFDEYKPSDMKSYQVDQLQDYLRKTTRGGDETRGNADQTVTRYSLEAPVVLSGEQQIQGSAEERRTIRTQFKSSTTGEGSQTARAYAKLVGGSYKTDSGGVEYTSGLDLKDHAKAIWQYIPGLDDTELSDMWQDSKDAVYDILSANNIAGVSDLEITALTMMRFGVSLYNKFAATVDADDDELPSDDQTQAAIEYIAGSMGKENRTSHVDEFLGLVRDAAINGYIDETDKYDVGDYKIVHKGSENEELRLKLSRVHAGISKYLDDHGIDSVDLLDSPSDYKSRMRDLVEDDDSYILDTSKNTPPLDRCVAIDIGAAIDAVDGLDRSFFVD